MAKVLVTGGAGYIGSHTVHLLLREGHDVAVVDDLSRGHRHNVPAQRLRELSLHDTGPLTDFCVAGRFDAIIHFAAFIAVGESTRDPQMYFANNLGGSLSLLTAMKEAGIRRLVFSSTAAVYGNPRSVPIREDAAIAPVNPYGESKAAVERILRWLDLHGGLRSIALRYFNACGAEPESGLGEEHNPETHLIPLVLRAIRTGKPVTIFGNDYPTPDGTCIRDYIHVSDLAAAHILALRSLLDGGPSDTMNVGTGRGHSVLEVLRAAEEATGSPVPCEFGARREGDPAELVADSTRLRQKLNWRPRHEDLKEIVASAWKFESKRKD